MEYDSEYVPSSLRVRLSLFEFVEWMVLESAKQPRWRRTQHGRRALKGNKNSPTHSSSCPFLPIMFLIMPMKRGMVIAFAAAVFWLLKYVLCRPCGGELMERLQDGGGFFYGSFWYCVRGSNGSGLLHIANFVDEYAVYC
eukprot:2543487-Rhodomonas_salina.2